MVFGIQNEINRPIDREETMETEKRSRVGWLREGDKNTQFFHGRET